MDGLRADLLPAFDPDRPLADAPDPWQSTTAPAGRSGPPWAMTEMIAAEPALAERILARCAGSAGAAARLGEAVRHAAEAGTPVVLTGCGTSEHAALAAAEIVRDAWRAASLPGSGPAAAQAFELALDPPATGLVIAISHEGATTATNRALAASRSAGARTALVTVTRRSPGAALADIVVETGELDQSWCHTVGYVSPIVATAAAAAHLAHRPLDARAVRRALEDGIAGALAPGGDGVNASTAAASIAARLADARQLLVIASGADRPAGRELVLKVEEASWLPSAYRDLETFLHGHLPATDDATGLVLVLADRAARDDRVARARAALAAARVLGLRSAAILAADASAAIEPALTPAGRIVVAEAPGLPASLAALLTTATALQLLTERIARARGTNPDPIRRDDERYRRAGEAAEAAG